MKPIRKCLFLLFLLSLLPLAVRADDLPFRDGDQVVIYDPKTGYALSALPSGSYNGSASVTMTEGVLSGFGDTEIWTLTAGSDGSWTLENGGAALALPKSGSYLRFGEVHSSWALESAGPDLYRLRNTGRNLFLLLVPRYGRWYTGNSAAGTSAFALYLLPRDAEEPEILPPEGYQLYFGLLHGHSSLSDGPDSVEDTFRQAASLENMDFFAITDHSHAFDASQNPSLTEDAAAISADWTRGKAAAQAVTGRDFVGLFGFEMAWNQQQGHISTFQTPGFLSREQDLYQSYATGMEAYFQALLDAPGSVSQFNHPDEVTGTFKDFSAYLPALDPRMTLLELTDTTEYYDRALSKGWHVAPTAASDTRRSDWLQTATARTAVLAESLTEEGILDALANRRVYATTDMDLRIFFTLNGEPLGSRLNRSQLENTVTLRCQIQDPSDLSLGDLEVVTQSGQVLETLALPGTCCDVTLRLSSGYDYFYLRLTQPDGDRAVTAPVWLENRDAMGISSLEPVSGLPTAGEPQQLQITFRNQEPEPLSLTSVTLTLDGNTYSVTDPITVPPYGTASCTFSHTFARDGIYSVQASASGIFEGEPRNFSFRRELTVMPPALVDDIRILTDENSAETFQHLMALAAQQDVDLQTVTLSLLESQLESCCLLAVSLTDEIPEGEFSAWMEAHIRRGGSILLCGASPDANPDTLTFYNALLEHLGASGRFLHQVPWDPVQNADSPHQIRTAVFSRSLWLEGLAEGQYFRQDGGTCIDPGSGQWLVKGLETAGSPVLLSAEDTGFGGQIFLAGCSFLSDRYLPSQTDSLWEQPSANQTIGENILGLLRREQPVIPIARLRQAEPGRIYLAEGRITAGTANPHNTFPDTLFLQDSTGGIAVTGYSTPGLPLGTRVRVLGMLDWAEENPHLKLLRLTQIARDAPILPQPTPPGATAAGCLIQAEGTVTERTAQGLAVSGFVLSDEDQVLEVRIEGSIRSGSRGINDLARLVLPGNRIQAIGICHWSGDRWVIRVRDCDEIRLLSGTPSEAPDTPVPSDPSPEDPDTTLPGTAPDPDDPAAVPSIPSGDAPDPTTFPEEIPEADPPVNPETGDPIFLWVGIWLFALWGLCESFRKDT